MSGFYNGENIKKKYNNKQKVCKMMFSLNSLIEEYERKKSIFSVMIELCTVCNWNCEYCYIDEHNNYGLKFDEIKCVLDELRKNGCFQVSFTGGEIFFTKRYMENN